MVSDDFPSELVRLQEGAWYGPTGPEIGALDAYGDPNTMTADIPSSSLARGPSVPIPVSCGWKSSRARYRKSRRSAAPPRLPHHDPYSGSRRATVAPGRAALARERAALYAWFATVYAEEMPEDRLAGWLGHGADPLLQALADGGMDHEVQAVRRARSLEAMAGIPDVQLELAADYAQCFCWTPEAVPRCMPRATSRRQLRACSATADHLAAYMASHDLRTDPDCREPMDHLAMELGIYPG